ncbi:DUF4340 domain-containing protein [Neolewinella agarilytica]|uniref:DUF4340 domain-containing protein n=1 Tax=Neolewinella agarilytica TaxID=478744 RepID=A0A1H8YYF1_9BACT|nr:DUF4340 domain-containing protein [Neolewinella agarilytica]SEP57215.1 protein of unknown function [Neolewinella agarilytica]
MNRTLILLLAVLLLGGIAWYATTAGAAPEKVSERGNDRQFGYSNIDEVHRIFIADRKEHTATFTRGGVTGWLVDGRPANENIMKNMMTTLQKIDIQSLPTSKAVPNMVKNLATEGILVQLFDEAGKKLRGYYIGGSTNDEMGTFAIMEGSENPYIVQMTGWTGNIRARFNLWDDDWRDKVYFRIDPDRVERFSIEYPTIRNKSFLLEKQGSQYQLKPFYESEQTGRDIARGVAEGILARYEKYYVNRYQNEDEKGMEEAKEKLPFAIITLKEEGEDEKVMELYPQYQEVTYQNDPKSGEVITSGDIKSFKAYINNGEDWVLLNVETTLPLLVGYDSF